MLILDESATTDVKFGCDPYERNLESLLDAGVILVDKPRGPTSHQLTAWAREMLGIQRLGHGGTLDPFATGLLTMLCGKATRLTEMVLTGDKKYIAIVKLGRQINATELEKAIAETKEFERRAHHHAEEKESLFLDETLIPDAEPITDSAQIDPVEDMNGAASLLDEDLKISEEVDLIEEDY